MATFTSLICNLLGIFIIGAVLAHNSAAAAVLTFVYVIVAIFAGVLKGD